MLFCFPFRHLILGKIIVVVSSWYGPWRKEKVRPNMAGLEEGFQYGLSSSSISSSNKTVVQVKLTDTALRIIEEYIKRKV